MPNTNNRDEHITADSQQVADNRDATDFAADTRAAIDVSVVVPCYNTETYLEEALTSALQNDTVSLELIVLNDGSTDSSLEIMRAIEATDSRVRVIDKENQGYGASVNRGLDEARGRYVCVLEPDDYVRPHMYDELFATAERYNYPDIVKSSFIRVTGAGTENERLLEGPMTDNIFFSRQPFTVVDAPELLRHHPSIWSALYRKDFLEEKSIRFMEVPGAGWVDNPFMVETLCQAASIVWVNKSFYCYREFLPGSSSDIKFSCLPFERWHNMVDILERLGVEDSNVWDAIYIRQFDCIIPQVELGALELSPYKEAIEGVCERMDETRVHYLPVVSPYQKSLFYQIRGLETPSDLQSIFLKARLKDFGRTLTHYGLAAFMRRVAGVISRGGKVDTDYSQKD